MEKNKKPKESWDQWEKMLFEEGFALNQNGTYVNDKLRLAWDMVEILDEFPDIADFRRWVRSYRDDPEKQEAVREFCQRIKAGVSVGTDTIQ